MKILMAIVDIEKVWNNILKLKSSLKHYAPISFDSENGFRKIEFQQDLSSSNFIFHKGEISNSLPNSKRFFGNLLTLDYSSTEEDELIDFISLYLPIVVLPFLMKDTLSIVHVAQSLDGKICTHNGNSQWIGNEENLIHSHRLRALVDGVLVGGQTIKSDLPSLSVRHVEGQNPKRIFFTSTFDNWNDLPKVLDTKIIHICSEETPLKCQCKFADYKIEFKKDDKNLISNLKEQLKNIGIRSMLIEGGSRVIGSFLESGNIDMIQFHIAPIMFGSGKSSISMTRIDKVADAVQLKEVAHYKIGEEIMICGTFLD